MASNDRRRRAAPRRRSVGGHRDATTSHDTARSRYSRAERDTCRPYNFTSLSAYFYHCYLYRKSTIASTWAKTIVDCYIGVIRVQYRYYEDNHASFGRNTHVANYKQIELPRLGRLLTRPLWILNVKHKQAKSRGRRTVIVCTPKLLPELGSLCTVG